VAHLDAAGDQRAAAPSGQGSPSRTSAASIVPSGVKSRPATVDDVLAGSLAPVTQRVPVDDARVDEVADPAGVLPSARADVALDQAGCWREVGLVERLDLGRLDCGLEALEVDLAVAGQPTRAARGCRRRVRSLTSTFFSVSAAVQAVVRRELGSLRWSTSVSMVGVSGVSSCVRGGHALVRLRGGRRVVTASTLAA
jgi:hypothetical protein